LDLAGVSQPQSCGSNSAACPALYVAGQDNQTWGTLDGGVTWNDMCLNCLGDSAAVTIDPALPTQMVSTRNGKKELWRQSNPNTPLSVRSTVQFWGARYQLAPAKHA
jgi:hypothetical protein